MPNLYRFVVLPCSDGKVQVLYFKAQDICQNYYCNSLCLMSFSFNILILIHKNSMYICSPTGKLYMLDILYNLHSGWLALTQKEKSPDSKVLLLPWPALGLKPPLKPSAPGYFLIKPHNARCL